MRRPLMLTLLLLAMGCALPSAVAAQLPAVTLLGVTTPGAPPTAGQILATETESGNAQSIVPGADACASAPRRPLSLPADDAPHNDETYFEYWYWYGRITTSDRRAFGVMLTFAAKPAANVYSVDYTLTEIATGAFHYGRQAAIIGRPRATAEGFELRGQRAYAAGGDGHDRLRFEVEGYTVDLAFDALKPPVPQYEDGHVNAYCNTSHFYNRHRLRTTGTLTHAGRTHRVTGTSDFVHQWASPVIEVLGWDWLTLNLDDGSDIFISRGTIQKLDGRIGRTDTATISDPTATSPSTTPGNTRSPRRAFGAATPPAATPSNGTSKSPGAATTPAPPSTTPNCAHCAGPPTTPSGPRSPHTGTATPPSPETHPAAPGSTPDATAPSEAQDDGAPHRLDPGRTARRDTLFSPT